MATDPRKRQKQHARKAAKRKAALTAKKPPGGLTGLLRGAHAIRVAAQAPMHECLMGQALFDTGLGTVIVSRVMPTGSIGAAFFLLDVYCLGVKNAYCVAAALGEYHVRLEQVASHETLTPIAPAYARKLVEAAEAYARDLGFSPHPDYHLAKKIFADIDATACPTSFTFGKDGKPFYVQGPHDAPQRVRRIVDTLTQHCGPNGFHYLVLMGETPECDDEETDETIIDVAFETLER
jgi:hypothetical protein